MRLLLRTRVSQPAEIVFRRFNQQLLQQLNPPFPVARIVRYDGQQPGHEVHIRLHFGLFAQQWHSVIGPEVRMGPLEWSFEDIGTRLPFFLRHWHHIHRVRAHPDGTSTVEDDIRFRTPWYAPGPIVWLLLWGTFVYRKPIYRRVFRAGAGRHSPSP
jgi:ligand-binding SRPBCC domain-containing protein